MTEAPSAQDAVEVPHDVEPIQVQPDEAENPVGPRLVPAR